MPTKLHSLSLLALTICLSSSALALSGSQCVQPEEYESINFQLQTPDDDGAWVPMADYSLLSFSLSHMEQREVFALGGQFQVERDGNAITPVFICEPGVPAVYHVGHYTVKCPEWAGQLIRIFSDETTLGDSGKIGVGRWENECIRWRTREYTCDDRVKPPPPPRKPDSTRMYHFGSQVQDPMGREYVTPSYSPFDYDGGPQPTQYDDISPASVLRVA